VLSEILDGMEHAVKVNGVTHIILDNLQFMMPDTGGGGGGWGSNNGNSNNVNKWKSKIQTSGIGERAKRSSFEEDEQR